MTSDPTQVFTEAVFYIIAILLILLLVLAYRIIKVEAKVLMQEGVNEQFGFLFGHLDLKSKSKRTYPLAFVLRRVLMAAFISLLLTWSGIAIQLCLQVYLTYMMYI
jgi:ABC-type Fe3+-siderophore transport system permease subunit